MIAVWQGGAQVLNAAMWGRWTSPIRSGTRCSRMTRADTQCRQWAGHRKRGGLRPGKENKRRDQQAGTNNLRPCWPGQTIINYARTRRKHFVVASLRGTSRLKERLFLSACKYDGRNQPTRRYRLLVSINVNRPTLGLASAGV